MEGSVPGLVAAAAAVCGMEKPPTICAKQVCSSKKVTDHHAIVPTISAEKVDMASLPLGEREVLKLAARGLLRACRSEWFVCNDLEVKQYEKNYYLYYVFGDVVGIYGLQCR